MDEMIKKKLVAAGVNMEMTMDRFMHNESLYVKFLKRLPHDSNFQVLEDGAARRSKLELDTAAHTLKGVTANLGLDPLAKIFQEMLKDIRYNDLAEYDQLHEKMKKTLLVFTNIIEEID